MNIDSGKVVIVTGTEKGIGQAIALRFGAEGAHVVVNDVNVQGAQETVDEIVANGGSAMAVVAEVSDKQQVDEMFDQTLAK